MPAMLPLNRTARCFGFAAMALVSTLAGCGGDDGKSSSESVVIDGSSTVFRISKVAQEAFSKTNESIEVIVGNTGTGGGFTKYLQNEIDIVDASRTAKPEEESKAKSQGLDWSRYVVGYDGITVVVNPKNDFVKDLTVAQLKAIWEPESKVKTWKDVDPSWPAREIKLYSPDDKSGTFEFFAEAIVGKAKSQRKDTQPSSDDNILVRGVSGDPDALGYFGYAYFKANESTLRAIPIKKDAESPAIAPNPANILAKTYAPLSRPLFIYVKKSSYRRPAVAAFVKFYLEQVGEFATKAMYVAPTGEDISANKATLEAAGVVTPSA